METVAGNVVTHCVTRSIDIALVELKYLCCYKPYVDGFKERKEELIRRKSKVLKDVKEAQDRNENLTEDEVEWWLNRADELIKEDTEGKKKWCGLITDYFSQYKRGKDLAEKKLKIEELMNKSNAFSRVARSTAILGIEFYSSQHFMPFKSRKDQIAKLKKALNDDTKFIIGLYGLGGTGKTSTAIEVGKEVAESKLFDKVIVTIVSKEPNLKKMQDNIAKPLDFTFNKGTDESERAQQLWKRIVEGGEKMLIILDDVWKELKLGDIGIPLGRQGKRCCAILLTTRDSKVCGDMGCNETVKLEALAKKDATDLFLYHAGVSKEDSLGNFKDVAIDIVNKCGRLPFAIIAVAKTLNTRPLKEWKQTLERLQNVEQIHDVKEDLKEAYHSLKLSYDNLKNNNAKQLFLLCSLFPEDYEIPKEFLTRIAMHLGLCNKANRYSVARTRFTPIMNGLISSCLLLEAGNESVKMHDLVRGMALWVGNEWVQVVMNSNATLKEKVKYSSWNIVDGDFPEHFDGEELEVLLVWINKENCPTVKVSDAIFEGMNTLKILALISSSKLKISAASLFQSPQSLINVQTLTIKEFELGDISILKHLKSLESLELGSCSIIELPKELKELEKLRLLEMVACSIQKNNPFEVIGSCLQLEELYYVSNAIDQQANESQYQITTIPKLQRYHITRSFDEVDYSISRYFDSQWLEVKFSKEIVKLLVSKVEVLILDGDCYNSEWTNIVPDILSVEDDNMEDHLTELSLYSVNGIKCLIDNKNVRSGVAIFSKLATLKLSSVDVSKLCCGPYPVNFLTQLKKLDLSKCKKLGGTLFNGNLELCNLKSIYLYECSMTCLFSPSIAQSVKQLERLHIEKCFNLKSIVEETTDYHDHDLNQKCHVSMFPKLKYLLIIVCPELEFIFPICICEDLPLLEDMDIHDCENLEYIFGKCSTDERYMHPMGKEDILQLLEEVNISKVPRFINIYAECYLPGPRSNEVQNSACPTTKVEDGKSSLSRAHLFCLWKKSNASTTHHPSTSMTAQTNHNLESKVKYSVSIARGPFKPLLYPHKSLRRMAFDELCGLKSLFTLSIASAFQSLEILQVEGCATLQQIVTDEEHGHDHMIDHSIFPNLQEIIVSNCSHLEYIFPAFYSKGFAYLEYLSITKVEKLTHVFGKCHADKDQNVQVDLNLPALKQLHLGEIPNMVNICADKYSVKELHLEAISLEGCQQLLRLDTLKDLFVIRHKRQENLPRRKEGCQQPVSLDTLKDLFVVRNKRQENLPRRKASPLEEKCKPFSNSHEFPEFNNDCVEPKSCLSFQNLSMLTIQGCRRLKFILSASTSRMLQKLKKLEVSDCEDLVSIVEDAEDKKTPPARHQVCFPDLRGIKVKHCRSLEGLFSRSCGKLPKLLYVNIEDAPKLVQVFGWNQGEGRELKIQDLVPKMYAIRLVNLPALDTICQGIDFHTVEIRHVRRCPTISLTSNKDSFLELLRLSLYRTNSGDEDGSYARDISYWAFEIDEEGSSHEDIGNDSTMPEQNNGENSEEVSKDIDKRDSTRQKHDSNLPNLIEKSTNASSNEIVEENLSATQSSNSDVAIQKTETSTKDIVEEQLSTSNKAATPSPESDRELCEKELKGDQNALGEGASLKQGPTNDLFTKETTKDVVNTTTTEMTSQLDPSIFSTPEKSQIATSTTHTEPKSSQSDLFDISITTECPQNLKLTLGGSRSANEAPQRVEEPTVECSSKDTSNEILSLTIPSSITGMTSPQDKIVSPPETSTEKEMMFDQGNHQQFADDDLVRLFQIMEECSETQVHMSQVSKIAALEDESELSKALTDLEVSLKMSLSEIACSEECKLRLQNALKILSSYCSEDGAPSHGLQATIHSLQQEIQTVLSSSKQAYTTIDTFNKLEQKKKLIIEERLMRKEAAISLLSEIQNKESLLAEAQQKEAELKGQISKFQAKIQECEIELLSLNEQKKKSISDTMGFVNEFEAVRKGKSHMVEENIKAKQQLQNMDAQWSSCLSDLKKASLLLEVHLQQKL